MRSLIRVARVRDGLYRVYYSPNGKYIGEYVQEVDGFYIFYPVKDAYFGAWSGEVLRCMADDLEKLNATYTFQIDHDPRISRIDIVGQNGNTGEHYDKPEQD